MLPRFKPVPLFLLIWLGRAGASITGEQPDGDVEGLQEQAMKAAVAKVAPCIVQIETSGGSDVIGSGPAMVRKGTAPTTGLVVGSDGYIISSAFNFANK